MGRHVEFERLHNFRDLGGYPAGDGHVVRWGRLYRSDSLSKLRDADWDQFVALGVLTVIDLRYPWEIEARGRVPDSDGFSYHNLSIEHRPYHQGSLGPDVDPVPFLADRYAEVAADGVKELRQALNVMAFEEAPIVFHCASGKDRTGLLAALVLSLLGVADDDIVADFALTELATDRLIADYQTHFGTLPQWPGYGRAPAALMRRVLADLATTYGSVHDYAANRLDADEHLIAALRKRLLEPQTQPSTVDP